MDFDFLFICFNILLNSGNPTVWWRWPDVDFLFNDIPCNFCFPPKHQQILYLAKTNAYAVLFRGRWLSVNWFPCFPGFIFSRQTDGFSQICSFHCSMAWYKILFWICCRLHLSNEKTDNVVLPWAPLQLCWGCIYLIHTSMKSQGF